MQIFISYSHKDRAFVSVLSRALRRLSVDVWLDDHQLEIGDRLSQRIEQAISRVDFVIVVISPNSVSSQWVNYELSLVLLREGKDNKGRLLPLLLKEDNVPAIIADRLIADFRTAETMNRKRSCSS